MEPDLIGGGPVEPGRPTTPEFEEQIRELHAEFEAAEADNDIERSTRLREELDRLVDHLAGSLGLGGRSRRAGGEAERARSAVTQRIRATIKRVETHDEALGAHLRSSVSTGTFCSYSPPIPTEWSIAS